MRSDCMWYRYKCYFGGKYIFSGIVYALSQKDVSENVKIMYGDKYEVKEIEKV